MPVFKWCPMVAWQRISDLIINSRADFMAIKLNSDKTRYLIAGCWNTAFGYLVGVGLFSLLSQTLTTILIAILANLVAISMTFLTYKLFVFRTEGNWLREYLRSYITYGTTAILGIFFFWFFIEILKVSIWATQVVITIATIIISYFINKYFIFTKNK